ncbi:MAG: glycosyltransferase family 2 protein [Ignavibacteria bacterium]|nr:glycosyltransferase family 2 protein [Ignavibacteria bacterium]MBT8392346.1 glycosyltransferase family 2 protein [Ignavibacteria bacterium]NNL22230.1 glycosyltransferase family 2 protein [Ignavibacteriaceae bacterium]
MNSLSQKRKLVSIAMTTYNGESYLAEQIESILAQSYKNIELIIVDDCSTDRTIDILNNYKEQKNIKIFKNSGRLGVINNFSKAISLCAGEYIALSDQDDIWYEEKIVKLLDGIESEENVLMICSDAIIIDTEKKIISPSWFEFQSIYIPKKKFVFYEVVYQNFALGCTMLFNRSLLKRVLPIPEESISHDWWIAANAALLGRIIVVNDQLILKRKHNANVSISEEDNFFIRIKKYLSKNERDTRKKRYQNSLDRIKCYLLSHMGDNKAASEFLLDLKVYYEDMLKLGIHFSGLKVAFKYRKVFYGGFSPISRAIQIFAKLF